jgi:hypothetical protein
MMPCLGVDPLRGHDDEDLARKVEPSQVVAAGGGVDHALAAEYGLRVHRERLLGNPGEEDQVLTHGEAAAPDRQAPRRTLGAGERHLLIPAAIVARRDAQRLHLGCDIMRCQFVAARAGVASFEHVVGEEGHVSAEHLRLRAWRNW